jgi:glycosyltransferase involved in cell wall biosynthesis
VTTRTPDHMFVVPAFGEPRWIERCLQSIEAQTLTSRTLITTSTPSAHLSRAAARFGVPPVVNPVSAGIAADWNFALTQADTEWITIAHQDDWYEPDYLAACMATAKQRSDTVLAFTASRETLEGSDVPVANTYVKRLICTLAFLMTPAIASPVRKRLLLSFGNPVPCASVMLNRRALPAFRFPAGWTSNLDWRAWLDLAGQPGAFVYVRRPLVQRTLHAGAATSRGLDDRAREDRLMFTELWPGPIARALNRIYAASRNPYGSFQTR